MGVDLHISSEMKELIELMKRKLERETGRRVTIVQASSILAKITKSSILKNKPVINVYVKRRGRHKEENLYNESKMPIFF